MHHHFLSEDVLSLRGQASIDRITKETYECPISLLAFSVSASPMRLTLPHSLMGKCTALRILTRISSALRKCVSLAMRVLFLFSTSRILHRSDSAGFQSVSLFLTVEFISTVKR